MTERQTQVFPWAWQRHVLDAIQRSPAVAIVGAAGAGKSTVAALAFSEADDTRPALLVTPSSRTLEQARKNDDLVVTNRLLREDSWSTNSMPLKAVARPEILASGPS